LYFEPWKKKERVGETERKERNRYTMMMMNNWRKLLAPKCVSDDDVIFLPDDAIKTVKPLSCNHH
jgi:hypothetical protein